MEQHSDYHRNASKYLRARLDTEVGKLSEEITQKQNKLKELAQRTVREEEYARLADVLIRADLQLIDAQIELETAQRAKEKEEKLRELESAVEKAKLKKNRYAQLIDKLKAEYQTQNNHASTATLLKEELANLQMMHEMIVQKEKQLDFESNQEVYRVSLVHYARVPVTPSDNRQLTYLAAAPVVVLFLVMGLFFIRELTAGAESLPVGVPPSGGRDREGIRLKAGLQPGPSDSRARVPLSGGLD
jgi:uncharacterized protein involved in exopolysaccharide biosynthesis